jgi:iron-sulfur cluster assembly accessory protein
MTSTTENVETGTTQIAEAVTVTAAAAENIIQLMAERNLSSHYLRIYVAGIGCSGPQYGLAFDKEARENDIVIHSDGLNILVDPNSLAFLEGATIDYVETPQGAGFKIENPNPLAAASCGSCSGSCG